MSTLKKNENENLTPEQKADLAKMEVGRARKRERLLKQARDSKYTIFATVAGVAIALGAVMLSNAPSWLLVSIFFLGLALIALAVGINGRLDALMRLLEDDHDL